MLLPLSSQQETMNYLVAVLIFSLFLTGECASKKSKHKHQGLLTPYDGHHISYNISLKDNERLNKVIHIFTLSLTH